MGQNDGPPTFALDPNAARVSPLLGKLCRTFDCRGLPLQTRSRRLLNSDFYCLIQSRLRWSTPPDRRDATHITISLFGSAQRPIYTIRSRVQVCAGRLICGLPFPSG
jgi:hypothetical protein